MFMNRWSKECSEKISKKAGDASKEIVETIQEKYGVRISLRGFGPNIDLQPIAHLGDTHTLDDLFNKLNDIRKLIKIEFKDNAITNEQIDKVIVPIVKNLLDFVFSEANKCNKEIPKAYREFYKELNKY